MTDREKELLRCKYGHSKILLALHFIGHQIKSFYHPSTLPKKLIISGKNNVIPYIPCGCDIEVCGDNNQVEIDSSIKNWQGKIVVGDLQGPVNNCCVRIGPNSTSNGCSLILYEDNSSIVIGKNCMFACNVSIMATDSHTIYDVKTKKLQNWGKEIVISDNVWLAMDCTILKNSFIAKNCVVGASAVVSGKFREENCVIAGNPAKVVKRGVAWDRRRPKEYIKEYPMN